MDFETIEDRIIEALKNDVPALRAVTSGALNRAGAPGEGKALRYPYACVSLKSLEFAPACGAAYEESAVFIVRVTAKSLRGSGTARRADAGAYRIIGDVLSSLANRNFGLGIVRLAPVSAHDKSKEEGEAVFDIELITAYRGDYGHD